MKNNACNDTAKYSVHRVHTGAWTLQSFEHNWNAKTIGGDELYVTLEDTAQNIYVGHADDLLNGSYYVQWHMLPENKLLTFR